MRPPVPFKIKGIHHLYLGFWFLGFGVFFLFMNQGNGLDWANAIYSLFIITGFVCIIDDLWEHLISADTLLRLLWEFILRRKS